MGNNNISSAAQIAGGTYLGYQALSHGLPRALGIRIEYHTTNANNAKLIKKAGNILDPAFGGKNGWGAKIAYDSFVENSKNYVHITGINDKTNLDMVPKKLTGILKSPFKTFYRKFQCFMYKAVGNSNSKELALSEKNQKNYFKWLGKSFFKGLYKNKTKRFCIPGIDSYFNQNFINDTDDIALKSTKKLKVYGSRLSAMAAGLKQFGLKGIKENKGRAAVGITILSAGLYGGYKLIKSGINKLLKRPIKQEQSSEIPENTEKTEKQN